MKEAVSTPEAEEWIAAAEKEWNSLADLQSFEWVDLPPGKKAYPTTLNFRTKYGADGSIVKRK
eukprot:501724-Hanusia_phi.AAC.1